MNPINELYSGSYPTEIFLDGRELVLRVNGIKDVRINLREKTAALLARSLPEPSYTLVPERIMVALKA